MLRITVEEKDNHTRLQLEGKLTGDWVGELERCWVSVHNGSTVNEFSVDLSSVSFVDENVKVLLRHMVSSHQ